MTTDGAIYLVVYLRFLISTHAFNLRVSVATFLFGPLTRHLPFAISSPSFLYKIARSVLHRVCGFSLQGCPLVFSFRECPGLLSSEVEREPRMEGSLPCTGSRSSAQPSSFWRSWNGALASFESCSGSRGMEMSRASYGFAKRR